MRLQLESTDEIITIGVPGGGTIQARVWNGVTEGGVRCFALVTRVAVHKDADASAFERELLEQPAPRSSDQKAYPSRLVL